MRSRRITIEGNRYLVFYTFEDEPWLGSAATQDAGAQPPAQQTGPATASPPSHTNESDVPVNELGARGVRAPVEPDSASVRARRVSGDEAGVTGASGEGEGRSV